MLIVIKYLQELINKLNRFKWKITKKKGMHTQENIKRYLKNLCLFHALYSVARDVRADFERKLQPGRFKY